jgi:hypothetical protein
MEKTMEPDPTDGARRRLLAQINSHAMDRSGLEARHGRVWDAAFETVAPYLMASVGRWRVVK